MAQISGNKKPALGGLIKGRYDEENDYEVSGVDVALDCHIIKWKGM